MRRYRSAVGSQDAYAAVLVAHQPESLVVDLAVAPPADEDEVVEIRSSTVGPVDDVVSLEAESTSATVNHAASVALLQLTQQPRRHRARGTSDADGCAVGAVDDGLDPTVARESSDDL